jgi:hypothetical protein
MLRTTHRFGPNIEVAGVVFCGGAQGGEMYQRERMKAMSTEMRGKCLVSGQCHMGEISAPRAVWGDSHVVKFEKVVRSERANNAHYCYFFVFVFVKVRAQARGTEVCNQG